MRPIVFSTTISQSPDAAVDVVADDIVGVTAELRAQPDHNIWLCGGAGIAGTLTAAGNAVRVEVAVIEHRDRDQPTTTEPGAIGDERPTIWIGHAGPVVVPDLDRAVSFYEHLGLRWIHGSTELAALQLRGGTHLVLLAGDAIGGDAPFDLMVDDLERHRERAAAAGLAPTPIETSGAHRRFFVTDPGGTRVRIHDSHVVGAA